LIIDASDLALSVGERMARRGWQFVDLGTSVRAHRPDWPTQLTVLLSEAREDSPAIFGLAIDLSTMPLRGERFRDIFDSEREQLLRGYGNFHLIQLTGDDTWLKPISERAFLHGISDGMSRKTRLAVFDRTNDAAESLEDRFAADSNRLVESGGEIASLLQRIYQRTVLSAPVAEANLPDLVRPSLALLPKASEAEPSYPWRR
jgi:hypothetical protein